MIDEHRRLHELARTFLAETEEAIDVYHLAGVSNPYFTNLLLACRSRDFDTQKIELPTLLTVYNNILRYAKDPRQLHTPVFQGNFASRLRAVGSVCVDAYDIYMYSKGTPPLLTIGFNELGMTHIDDLNFDQRCREFVISQKGYEAVLHGILEPNLFLSHGRIKNIAGRLLALKEYVRKSEDKGDVSALTMIHILENTPIPIRFKHTPLGYSVLHSYIEAPTLFSLLTGDD